MDRKIRVGAVSYLNTKPLVWGFEQGMMSEEIDLVFDYPANLSKMLGCGELDIALLPVASIAEIKIATIISDYCIGASSAVASVCLFSDVPLNEIKEILLDYQSKSSVALLKVLLKKHWKKDIPLISASAGYEMKIEQATAGLVIGDRAFELRGKYKYVYDLAEAWIEWSKLPFVFAAWVSNRQLPADFLRSFNAAIAEGLTHLEEIVTRENYKHYDLKQYYTQNIDYVLDDAKRAGMKRFLELIGSPS